MPAHLDFMKEQLTLQAVACEVSLLVDNVARLFGATVADSLNLTYTLLERFSCI